MCGIRPTRWSAAFLTLLLAVPLVFSAHGSTAEALTGVTAADLVTVHGRVRWTDSLGVPHPARGVRVEVLDFRSDGSLRLITAATTNNQGRYAASFANGEDGRYDLVVQVRAQGPGFAIQPLHGPVYAISSRIHRDIADGTDLAVDFTANNVADHETAFSIADALSTAVRYVTKVHGNPLPDVGVYFPGRCGGSCFSGDALHISRTDRFDWDVIHHEYGHYVSEELGIVTPYVGGRHCMRDHLSEERCGDPIPPNKEIGVQMAWNEGWPTFFGILLQREMGAAAWGIPNVGDTWYQETEEADWGFSLEESSDRCCRGEDDELAVARALWDLYDPEDDAGDQGISFDDSLIWSRLDAADASTFSAAYLALMADESPETAARVGCIIGEHGIGPSPFGIETGMLVGSGLVPFFLWRPNGGGPAFRSSQFQLSVYDQDWNLLSTYTNLTKTNFRLSQADWLALLQGPATLFRWTVTGQQTDSPATGPYVSCAKELKPMPPDSER